MFLLMQNIFIVPAMQHGSRAKPLLGAYYCEYLNYNNWCIVVLWIHLAWPSSRNLCTSESIVKCRDIVHIFTCRARDKVTFTCTTAPKVGHLGKIFFTSHRRFSFICFCKRCFDESFRFILNRSISVSFLKH